MKSILIAALSATTICGFAALSSAAAQATAPGSPRGTAPVTIEGYRRRIARHDRESHVASAQVGLRGASRADQEPRKTRREVFQMHGTQPKQVDCPAIDGIIEEADEVGGEIEDKNVLDAALIASAQAVEHYEMNRYGTLIAWLWCKDRKQGIFDGPATVR
jgi:hypothetical protein